MTSLSDITVPISDPLFETTLHKARIPTSTNMRESSNFVVGNGMGSRDQPLNGPNRRTCSFNMSGTQLKSLRFNSCALRMDMIFCKENDPNASLPTTRSTNLPLNAIPETNFNVPSWEMTGNLIEQVELYINGGLIYKSSENYGQEFTAGLLRNHSYESLNSLEHTLFCPVFDSSYTAATDQDDIRVDAIAHTEAENPAGAIVEIESNHFAPRPIASVGVSPAKPYILGQNEEEPVAGAEATFDADTIPGVNYRLNKFADGDNLRKRAELWCRGPNTHLKVITKIITFADLVPRLPDGVFRNMRSLRLDVKFSNTYDHLMHTTTLIPTGDDPATRLQPAYALGQINAAGRTYRGECRVTRADLLLDYFHPDAISEINSVTDKVEGKDDIIPMLVPQLSQWNFVAGSDLVLPHYNNVDSVLIWKPLRNTFDARRTVAAPEALVYQSNGQFALFNTTTTTADSTEANSTFIRGVQVRFNQIPYPQSMLETVSGNFFNATRLYYEYRRAIRRLNRIDGSPSIPFEYFAKTMPMIWLRPFQDHAPAVNQKCQLTISCTDGTSEPNVSVIIWRYKIVRLTADGGIVVFE